MKDKIDIRSIVLGMAFGGIVVFSLAAVTSKESTEVLRVHKLVIVDENGTDRIVIAAPVPDPQIRGKRVPRRTPGAGIQINDASGNERGGMAALDDGSFVVGIDDEAGRERAHMYFIPKRGAGLLLQGANGRERISLSIPSTDASSGEPSLEITNQAGQATVALPSPK